MRVLIHIGFGKNATTTIQEDIFPYLEKKGVIDIVKNDKIIEDFRNYILFDDIPNPISLKDNGKIKVISLEFLIGWNPDSWDKCFEFNKIYFPKNSEIIVTFRRQDDYLNSVYLQMLQQGESDLYPNDFFLKKSEYKRFSKMLGNSILESTRHFSVDDFKYSRIAELYSSYFNKCYLFNFEIILDQSFLKILFKEYSFKQIPIKQHNKSFKLKCVELDRKRYNFLKILSLKQIPSNKIPYMKKASFRVHKQNVRKTNSRIIIKILKKILFPIFLIYLLIFKWRYFLQLYVNPFCKEKFYFDTSKVVSFHEENEHFYNKLPLIIENETFN